MPDSIFNYFGTITVIIALPALGIVAKFFKVSFARIAKWYCYAAVFAVLVVINSIFFPFIGGKDYFFRFAVELGLIAVLLWWAFEAKAGEVEALIKVTFRKPLVIAVSVFVAAVELASIFAFDAHAAFWSNYERGEGGFQMLHYYAFFLLLALLFKDENDWKNIFKFSLVAATGMIGYGVFANLGIVSTFISPYAGGAVPVGWWHQIIDGRFEGSLGNPAYVAPYLMFSMFFAGYLWVSGKISGSLTTAKAWTYAAIIAVLMFFFYTTQTRGAFLGLAAGIFIILGYMAFQESAFVRKLSSAIVLIPSLLVLIIFMALGHGFLGSVLDAAVVGVLLGGITFLACLAFSKDAFLRKWSRIIWLVLAILVVLAIIIFLAFVHSLSVAENLPGARSFQISANDITAQTRFWVWGEAWQGFLQRPIFGWGPENFTAVFDKFFNPNFFVPGQNTETWFDRAHSVFFDYLSETGIVGLLSYLGIFFIFAREFVRRKKKDLSAVANSHTAAARSLQNALVLAMPVAYLVQGVAIFDVLPMYISLFLFLAFANYYFTRHERNV